jgi:F0F1-type ATP synthase membrane subunit b/b'
VTAAAQRECEELGQRANARLAEAETDAGQIRQQAGDDAEAILAQAEERAQAAEQRAQRRISEAESNARAVRERAAEHLAQAQEEAREARRTAREDASRTISQARQEADELRSKARSMLSEARAEVAVLSAHRDEISKQLGDLSGVIEALAVSERPNTPRPTPNHTDEVPRNS